MSSNYAKSFGQATFLKNKDDEELAEFEAELDAFDPAAFLNPKIPVPSKSSSALDVSPEQDRSVLKTILRQGVSTGPDDMPLPGATMKVHYIGRLAVNGKVFDSSRDRNEPIWFKADGVILGWKEGIPTMKRGELAELYIHHTKAYGPEGKAPKIPPMAALVFEVELIDWENISRAPSNALDICGDGTVKKMIINEGKKNSRFGSSPSEGMSVTVHYVGKLQDGTEFDSSRGKEKPFTFRIGQGVIQGWSDGVASMCVGEKSMFWIEPGKGYGESGSPPKIPPNSILCFEIELLSFIDGIDISDESNDSLVKKTVQVGNTDGQMPTDLATCKVNYSVITWEAKLSGDKPQRIIEVSGQNFVVDDDDKVFPGIQKAIKFMKTGEKAEVAVFDVTKEESEKYGFPNSDAGSYALNIELLSVTPSSLETKAGDDFKVQLDCAEKIRQKGNESFKAQNIPRAIRRYERVLQILHDADLLAVPEDKKGGTNKASPMDVDLDKYSSASMAQARSLLGKNFLDTATTQKKDERRSLQSSSTKNAALAVYKNISMCYIKSKDFRKGAENARQALGIDRRDVKALFRLGTCEFETNNFDVAKSIFLHALDIEPDNKSIATKLKQLEVRIAAFRKKEKGMFSK
eukprot:UC4_evm15s179